MNIGFLLPRHARYRPENLAFVVGKERLNFFELNERVNRLANALLDSGIRKGQKMGRITYCSYNFSRWSKPMSRRIDYMDQ